jgi:hypothetical protein
MKTAVEWLFNNLKSHFEHDGDLLEVVQMSFEKAKEMENSQATEYAKWSLGIYELHARFFTFLEWIKDEPKDERLAMKLSPKEKAKDLQNKFGKELAPKVVDEIINALETYDDVNDTFELQNMDGDFRYWDKVKHELTKQQEQ